MEFRTEAVMMTFASLPEFLLPFYCPATNLRPVSLSLME
jgi:hypothetical protein